MKPEVTSLIPIAVNHEGRSWSLFKTGEEGEPLAKDVDVAKWLGFERPRDFRKLIDRHAEALGEVSRHRGAKPSAPTGGRPEEGYLLREDQALYLAAKSETPNAQLVLKTLIAVFMAARRGVTSLECDHGDTYVKSEDPRSDEEKRVLISTLLKAGWGECSDRVIARGLFVSHTTVSKILPKPKPELELLQQLLEGQAALRQEVAELRARQEAPQLPAAPVFTADQVTALLKGAR